MRPALRFQHLLCAERHAAERRALELVCAVLIRKRLDDGCIARVQAFQQRPLADGEQARQRVMVGGVQQVLRLSWYHQASYTGHGGGET